MSAAETPGDTKRRTRAKTAKIEFPLPASPSTRLLAISNGKYLESNFHGLNFVKTNLNSLPIQSSAMSQHQSGVVVESSSSLPRSSVFQAHSGVPLPLRPPPPINPKLRILKTAKSFSRKVDPFQDNAYTNSPVDRLERWPITPKAAKKFSNHGDFTKDISKKGVTYSFPTEGARSASRNCGNVDDRDLTPDMNRLKENEEKMQLSSESLHMDHTGLKEFPILGPNDRHVRLLSLQHNSISRLQNLVVLSHLIVLDLYCNRIERISGLQSFHCLRVLLLGKNRIRRMEGLEGLRRLEILDLHGNQLRYLDNLNTVESLRIINVAGNAIRSIRNFGSPGLGALVELNLKRNRLRSINGLEKACSLKKLLISNNELQNMSSLIPLTKLPFLEELLVEANPLCSIPDYNHQVLSLLPSLTIFDRVSINEQMRQDARNWQRQDREESRNVQQPVRVPMISSRDEIIQKAQMRWESVKDYVKNKANVIGKNWREGPEAPYASNEDLRSTADDFEPFQITECVLARHPKIKLGPNEKFPKKGEEMEIQTSNRTNFQVAESESEVKVGSIPFEFNPSPKLSRVAIVRPRIRKLEQNILPNPQMKSYTDQSLAEVPQRINPVAQDSVKPITNIVRRRFSTDLNIQNQWAIQRFQLLPEAEESAASEDHEREREHENRKQKSHLPRSSSLSSILPAILSCESQENDSGSGSSSSSINNLAGINARGLEQMQTFRKDEGRGSLRRQLHRSSSVDTHFQNAEEPSATNISEAPIPARRRGSASVYRHVVPRRSRQRGQTAKPTSNGPQASPRLSSFRRPTTGIRDGDTFPIGKPLKRVKSLSTISSVIRETVKKQGSDYLMEIDGKTLSLYGQGALKQFLIWFPKEVTENVDSIKFHFITYDTIVPHFEKLRQTYPSAEHFHFRANNLTIIGQLNAMADLQGITSIHVIPEGNPIVENPLWENYAIYRLAHWGLKQINGKEVASDYYGGLKVNEGSKVFESLGYLALSCLPQTILTPLATKLHTLQTFCCCSQSNSSEDSGRKKGESESSSDSVCHSWDSDPVLLDVIGKEALLYNSPKNEASGTSEEIASAVVQEGLGMLEKLNKLDESLPEILQRGIEAILIDYICLEDFMKKELKKVKDLSLIMNKKV